MPIASIRPRPTGRPGSSAIRTHQPALPRTRGAHPVSRCRVGKNPGVPHQSVRFAGRDRLRPLQEPMAGRAVLQVDQAASANQAVLRDIRKRGENTDLVAVPVCVLVAIIKKRLKLEASLYTLLQVLSVRLFEKLPLDQALTHDADKGVTSQITNQLDLFAY